MQETTQGIWMEPLSALEGNGQGEVPLSPPTQVTHKEFITYSAIKDLYQESTARFWGEPRLPRMIKLPAGALIVEPWDPMIHEEFKVHEKKLKDLVLSPGKPFSRLWLSEGIWRPVGI
jgi:hypothetical protein